MTDHWYVTPEDLEQIDACPSQVEAYRTWLEDRGWSRARPTRRNLLAAYAAGLDVIWAAAEGVLGLSDAALRLWGCDCAERALDRLDEGAVDERSREAIEVSRQYAHGRATDEDLSAARVAAWAAESDAARSAEWAAEWAASCAAEWAAAPAAERAAERAAEWAAAKAAERTWQVARLAQYVEHGVEAEGLDWPEIEGEADGAQARRRR